MVAAGSRPDGCRRVATILQDRVIPIRVERCRRRLGGLEWSSPTFMQLHEHADAALERVLATVMRSRAHPLDLPQWYDFVHSYQRHHGFDLNQAVLRREIERRLRLKGIHIHDGLEDLIWARVSLMRDLLDFLEHTGR
jgi:hypothetical protein